MINRELISDDISPLMTSDNGIVALSMMEEYRVRHLPIVNSESLLGVVSEDDILSMSDIEAPIGSIALSLHKPYVFDYQHVYDLLREIANQKLTILPVVDSNMRYLGVVSMDEILISLSKLSAIDLSGGIIVLEMNEHDYSLAQIAQIVESNNAKILSSYLLSVPNSTSFEVTIKVNTQNINPILQTFSRYNYQVKNTIFDDKFDELGDRYDSFMRYLNI